MRNAAGRPDQSVQVRDQGKTMKNIGAFSIATPNLGGNAGILDAGFAGKHAAAGGFASATPGPTATGKNVPHVRRREFRSVSSICA
jgi:hypothetical protein